MLGSRHRERIEEGIDPRGFEAVEDTAAVSGADAAG